MPKFRVGDIAGTRSNPGYEYEVVAVHGPDTVDVKVLKGEYANGHIYYAVGTEKLHLLRPAFTLLDDEGRKALKAGDRVLVECEIASIDCDGGFEVSPFHPASHQCLSPQLSSPGGTLAFPQVRALYPA